MRTRDADYRGQSTSIDWSKLVHMTRMGKSGALEVLQDAIEIYFPNQFNRAQLMARQDAKRYGQELYVLFDGRIARNRFKKNVKQHPRAVPFSQANRLLLSEYGAPVGQAIVYSTKGGKDFSRESVGQWQRRSRVTTKRQHRTRKREEALLAALAHARARGRSLHQ